jgi:hypothetical protein
MTVWGPSGGNETGAVTRPPGAGYSGAMSDEEGLRGRVTRQGEEAIGKLAQDLLDNPVVTGALSAAFETRERAVRAQELAMGALNLPSASDLERLTRRLRGVSQRLEGIEDGLDRVEQRIDGLGASSAVEQRLSAIEQAIERLEAKLDGSSVEQRVQD